MQAQAPVTLSVISYFYILLCTVLVVIVLYGC